MKVLEAHKKLCNQMARNQFTSMVKEPKDGNIVRNSVGDVEVEVKSSNGIFLCQTKNCMAWEAVSVDEGYCVPLEALRQFISLNGLIEGGKITINAFNKND